MNGKRIYIVGRRKGGVGKSLVSMALIDNLQPAGEKVLLIELEPPAQKRGGVVM